MYRVKRQRCISFKQQEYLKGLAKVTGYTDEMFKRLLADYGCFKLSEVTQQKYWNLIEEAGSGERANIYKDKVKICQQH